MTVKPRSLTKNIRKDLKEKMVLVCGPRQAGKTTDAKELIVKYINTGTLAGIN